MNILVDHNLIGHAILLSGSILSGGWLDLVFIRFITFDEMGLPINSDDRSGCLAVGSIKQHDFVDSESEYERRKLSGTSDA